MDMYNYIVCHIYANFVNCLNLLWHLIYGIMHDKISMSSKYILMMSTVIALGPPK